MGKVGPRSRSQSLTPGPTIEEVPEEEEAQAKEVQDLEKSFEQKLRQLRCGKRLEKRVVMVDWHHTLEVKGAVSSENKEALMALFEYSWEILLCSYVNSTWRQRQVLDEMEALEKEIQQDCPAFKFLGKETVRYQCGPNGKADHAWKSERAAIFDDNVNVLRENLAWGIQPYPICTPWEWHDWTDHNYLSFAEAVDAFLDYEEL